MYSANVITVRKNGFYDQSTNINTQFQMVGLWNILTIWVGFAVDAADGNIIKIDPNQRIRYDNVSEVSERRRTLLNLWCVETPWV